MFVGYPIFSGSNSSLLLVEFTMFDDEISIFDGMLNGSNKQWFHHLLAKSANFALVKAS